MFAGVCRIAAALAILSFSVSAFAQVIPPGERAGRERERFVDPPAPRAVADGPVISLPSTQAPAGAATVFLVVRRVQVEGSTVYRAEELAALYQDIVGKRVSLQAVYDLAARFTAKYGNDGYVLSRAIVPPQELSPGGATVRIKVIEGYVDKVEWPAALSRYRDFFSEYTAKIIAQRPTNIRTIERYLLLASDLPGLKFKNTLKPSASETGGATLVVEVTEKPIEFNARVDNRGSKARGPLQFLVGASLNNIFHQHEALTVNYAAASPQKELQYVSAAYRQVLTSEGLTLFSTASYSWGFPGTPDLRIIDFNTRSTYAETGLSYPVIRSRERNLQLSALAFMSDSRNDTNIPGSERFQRDYLRGIRLRVDADAADPLQGINQVNVYFSQGFEGLGSSRNLPPIAVDPLIHEVFPKLSNDLGRADFSKIEAQVSRLQPLVAGFSVFAAAYAQYAFTPLLAPEQCGYGGRFFGRAFDPSQFTGDSCWEVLGELRFDLPLGVAQVSQAQLYAFADHGELYNRGQLPPLADWTNGSSIGGGLRLGWQNQFSADLSVAKAVDHGPIDVRDEWRFYFILQGRS
jgi:hemolysin activation/secretion protein